MLDIVFFCRHFECLTEYVRFADNLQIIKKELLIDFRF